MIFFLIKVTKLIDLNCFKLLYIIHTLIQKSTNHWNLDFAYNIIFMAFGVVRGMNTV